MKCSDGPYKGCVAGLEAEIEAALEAGLDGEVVWNMLALIDAAKGGDRYDFNGRMDNWDEEKDLARLREIFFKAKKLVLGRGWPEVILYAVDEPGTQFEDKTFLYRSMDILLKASKEIDSLGGRAHSTITECVDEKHNKAPRWSRRPDEMRDLWNECRPYLHVRNYGYGYPQGKTDLQHEMDDARHRGQDVWFYNNAAVLGRDRNCARVYWGLWGWKVGADGLTAWTHPRARTIQFELCREGIDDARYLALTEQLCLTLLPEDPARKEAEEFLARLRDSVKLDENGFVGSWADVVAGAVEMKPGEGEWKAVDFPSLKRALAQRIRALVEARRRYPAELDELRAMARTWRLTKANEKAKQLLARAPADEVGPLRGFDPGSGASLRRWVIKHGRGRWLKVSRGGRTVRAKVVSANLLGVQVRFMGEEMLARWENITPEELYRFCKKIEGPGSYGYAFTTPLFRRSASRDTGLGRRTFDAFAYSFFGGDL